MPVPPWEEVDESPVDEEPDSGSSGRKSSGSKPTSKARGKRQRAKRQHAIHREDAQLNGSIPTTPEGAVRDEVVDPATQSEQVFPNLIATAVRRGWAVPEVDKPGLVDELIQIAQDSEQGAKVRIQAFNALRLADQQQYEHDHPEEAAKAKGGQTPISIQANIQAVTVIREMVESGLLSSTVLKDTSSLDSSLKTAPACVTPVPATPACEGNDQPPTGADDGKTFAGPASDLDDTHPPVGAVSPGAAKGAVSD